MKKNRQGALLRHLIRETLNEIIATDSGKLMGAGKKVGWTVDSPDVPASQVRNLAAAALKVDKNDVANELQDNKQKLTNQFTADPARLEAWNVAVAAVAKKKKIESAKMTYGDVADYIFDFEIEKGFISAKPESPIEKEIPEELWTGKAAYTPEGEKSPYFFPQYQKRIFSNIEADIKKSVANIEKAIGEVKQEISKEEQELKSETSAEKKKVIDYKIKKLKEKLGQLNYDLEITKDPTKLP